MLLKSTPPVLKAEKVSVENFRNRDKLKSCSVTNSHNTFSVSRQCSSTLPVPSATEAMIWMSWACPSGGTSGSSASRCTPPPATHPSQRWWTSSWRKSESRDMPSPSRFHDEINFPLLFLALPTRHLVKCGWFFPCASDANRPAMLSVLTARARGRRQGTHSAHSDQQTPANDCGTRRFIHNLCCRLAAWTLRSKRTSPTSPSTQTKSSTRSKEPRGYNTLSNWNESPLNKFLLLSPFPSGTRAVWWFAKYSLHHQATRRDPKRK